MRAANGAAQTTAVSRISSASTVSQLHRVPPSDGKKESQNRDRDSHLPHGLLITFSGLSMATCRIIVSRHVPSKLSRLTTIFPELDELQSRDQALLSRPHLDAENSLPRSSAHQQPAPVDPYSGPTKHTNANPEILRPPHLPIRLHPPPPPKQEITSRSPSRSRSHHRLTSSAV